MCPCTMLVMVGTVAGGSVWAYRQGQTAGKAWADAARVRFSRPALRALRDSPVLKEWASCVEDYNKGAQDVGTRPLFDGVAPQPDGFLAPTNWLQFVTSGRSCLDLIYKGCLPSLEPWVVSHRVTVVHDVPLPTTMVPWPLTIPYSMGLQAAVAKETAVGGVPQDSDPIVWAALNCPATRYFVHLADVADLQGRELTFESVFKPALPPPFC